MISDRAVTLRLTGSGAGRGGLRRPGGDRLILDHTLASSHRHVTALRCTSH
jgi:hypothetical protein